MNGVDMSEVLWKKSTVKKKRRLEWVAQFWGMNGHIPTCAWDWRYSNASSVYRKPQGKQVTRMNHDDGTMLILCPRAEPWKLCNNCNKEFPANTDYFHRDRTGKYGVKAICRYCRNPVETMALRHRRLLPA
jgi:hypothetical protein